MEYIIFDTETTDLKGEVIQLSYMRVDEQFNIKDFRSFYCDTDCDIKQGAINVHGITRELLEVLSEGKYFEDRVLGDEKVKSIFIDGTGYVFMGYNVMFDIDSVNRTLLNCGSTMTHTMQTKSLNNLIPSMNYTYDIMNAVTRHIGSRNNIKLSMAVDVLVKRKYPEIDIDVFYENLKSQFGIKTRGSNYHDASYDVICTYLVLLSLMC